MVSFQRCPDENIEHDEKKLRIQNPFLKKLQQEDTVIERSKTKRRHFKYK